jgi:hypothetical protein
MSATQIVQETAATRQQTTTNWLMQAKRTFSKNNCGQFRFHVVKSFSLLTIKSTHVETVNFNLSLNKMWNFSIVLAATWEIRGTKAFLFEIYIIRD